MNRWNKLILISFCTLLSCVSCTWEKNGMIVMDKDGNYYELHHNNKYMGDEMYRLKPIDTTRFRVKGFNAR